MLTPSRLRAALDELVSGYIHQSRSGSPAEIEVVLEDSRYSLTFKGGVRLSIDIQNLTFDVVSAVTPQLSYRGVQDAAQLYTRVRSFIGALVALGCIERS